MRQVILRAGAQSHSCHQEESGPEPKTSPSVPSLFSVTEMSYLKSFILCSLSALNHESIPLHVHYPSQCRSLSWDRRIQVWLIFMQWGVVERVIYKLHLYNLSFICTAERRQLKESFGNNPHILMPVQFGIVIRNVLCFNLYTQF